jgi:AcrR family transcriptional regulator
MNTVKPTLAPRKMPVQARSAVTIEAIFTATIQVLLQAGFENLTTTKVALRAGVSVGTLYQYFPNKSALLAAVLEQYLATVMAL